MTEKKVTKKVDVLEPAMYWEWRCSIQKLQLAALNKKRVHLERECLSKDVEIAKHRLEAHKGKKIAPADAAEETAKHEYEALKEKLEKVLGFPPEECVIDDETFQVKHISELENPVHN